MNITEEIFRDFRAGKIQGFYHEVYPSLLTYAARCLGESNGYMAEDCTQESIFKAYCKRDDFDTPGKLKSYLYICIHNDAVSYLRKYHSSLNYQREQDHFEKDIQHAIIEQETLDLLFEAISSLPADLREFFSLCFEQGLRNAEVALRIGLSESSVKKKKAKMLQLLREHFKDNERMLLLLALLSIVVQSS